MPYANPADQATANRRHYEQNKERIMARTKARRAELRHIVDAYKLEAGCALCGAKYPGEPYVFDFHHTDPASKDRAVTTLINAAVSVARLMAEIEKCEVLCAVCHRRVEYGS